MNGDGRNFQPNTCKPNTFTTSCIVAKGILFQDSRINMCKSKNVDQHNNKVNDPSYMIISIDTEKSTGKVRPVFMLKIMEILGIE